MTKTLKLLADLGLSGNTSEAKILKDEIIDRFDDLYSFIGSQERKTLTDFSSSSLSPTVSGQASHAYSMSIGEELSARYFATAIGAEYVDPTWVVFNERGVLNREKQF
jgi:aspartokinase